ncbi:hypothetical protein J4211_06125 [Candidatus Woesearchaeota archaeon]|nr:hypothetical protein [Candidatus Woesearchaeota archaeon]
MAERIVEKFVASQKAAQDLLLQGNVIAAKQKYLDVLDAYHEIDKSSLPQFHKELAYDQVNALFRQVNDAKEQMKIPYNLIIAGILILALSVGVVLKPSCGFCRT